MVWFIIIIVLIQIGILLWTFSKIKEFTTIKNVFDELIFKLAETGNSIYKTQSMQSKKMNEQINGLDRELNQLESVKKIVMSLEQISKSLTEISNGMKKDRTTFSQSSKTLTEVSQNIKSIADTTQRKIATALTNLDKKLK